MAPAQFTFTVHGFEGCGYFSNAVKLLQKTTSQNASQTAIRVNTKSVPRQFWPMVIQQYATSKGIKHTTSPLIFCNGIYVGGFDALTNMLG